jgi:hypothetical protein
MGDAQSGIYRPKMFVNEPWYSSEPLPATSWLIKDFLPEGTPEYPYLMVIGGDPGSYKTTVLAAMFGSLTTGISFLGRKAKQRETLLVAGEDPWGAKKRGQAVFINLDVSPEEVTANFFNTPVNLYNSSEVEIAAEDIIGQGMKPKVIAFDTTFACSEGADLTKQIFMVHVLNNARRLCRAVGATNGILSHHNTKDSKSLYGSVGLPATVDVIINCKDKGGDKVEISNERMKMDRKFAGFTVQLTPVKIEVLRTDEDEGTTEVVEEEWLVVPNTAEAETTRRRAAASAGPGRHEKNMQLMMVGLVEGGGRATNKQWQERMRALTTQWKDGKVMHEGWSRATFMRKLEEFKAWCPNLRGGPEEGGQDHPYWLESAQPPGDVSGAETGLTKSNLTPSSLTPYSKGVIPLETADCFWGVSGGLKEVS